MNKVAVLVGANTLANVRQALRNCEYWLNKDAQYSHPKSKLKELQRQVAICIKDIDEDIKLFSPSPTEKTG